MVAGETNGVGEDDESRHIPALEFPFNWAANIYFLKRKAVQIQKTPCLHIALWHHSIDRHRPVLGNKHFILAFV